MYWWKLIRREGKVQKSKRLWKKFWTTLSAISGKRRSPASRKGNWSYNGQNLQFFFHIFTFSLEQLVQFQPNLTQKILWQKAFWLFKWMARLSPKRTMKIMVVYFKNLLQIQLVNKIFLFYLSFCNMYRYMYKVFAQTICLLSQSYE